MLYKITKGLDLHLSGVASHNIETAPKADLYYIRPSNFRWFTPKLLVNEGDTVSIGTPLLASKKDTRIIIASPIQGTVKSILRGEKRVIEAIVIQAQEDAPDKQIIDFDEPNTSNDLIRLLLSTGLWPMIRQRPFSTIASPDQLPKALFISCFDSAPLAPDINMLLKNREEDFEKGLCALRTIIGEAPIYLCLRKNGDNAFFENITDVKICYFQGPHPAGNIGTQIHYIAPLDKGEHIWYIHPQDIAAIGQLLRTHQLCFEKVIAVTGPCALKPQYYKVIYGSDISPILKQVTKGSNVRYISGNVLTGEKIDQFPTIRFYDTQLSMIDEGGNREFIGWLLPGFKKWSFSHTFTAWLFKHKVFKFNTSLHGGRRNFIMTDIYDKVFPFDIIPLALLKACLTKDIEQMEELGIYEVDDEDFALCEVVCPSKMECQEIIRNGLKTIIEEN